MDLLEISARPLLKNWCNKNARHQKDYSSAQTDCDLNELATVATAKAGVAKDKAFLVNHHILKSLIRHQA